MKINQVIQTNDGVYTFAGEVTDEEHALLLEAGFKLLFGLGMLPFRAARVDEDMPSESIN